VRTFYPLVGSISDYQKNVADILSTIQSHKYTRKEAIEWTMRQYKSSREFCRKLLDMLKVSGFIAIEGKRYKLTPISRIYLKTGQPDLLTRVFIDRVVGFAEMVRVLRDKGTIDKSALRSEWESSLTAKLPRSQFDHRLNWLRGLGCVDVVARNYYLTDRGLKIAADIQQNAVATLKEKEKVSHSNLAESMKLIGEFFEFETTDRASINDVLPSFALKLTKGDRQVDCLWVRYVHFAGKIKFPIEVHLGGNLADTIDRLETVSEYVQKAVIITTDEQEKEIRDRLKVKKSRLLDKLVIVNTQDVYKAVQATNVLKSFTSKIFSE